MEDGSPWFAVVNASLLDWDSKASHPWILRVDIKFQGAHRGLPDNDQAALLNAFEDAIISELKDSDGYLNIGRETFANERAIYFTCHEFRKPAKVLEGMRTSGGYTFDISYELYKDKYWQSLERFKPAP